MLYIVSKHKFPVLPINFFLKKKKKDLRVTNFQEMKGKTEDLAALQLNLRWFKRRKKG
jgi:hypothetical protein